MGLKIPVIVLVLYAAVVGGFEALIGYTQPESGDTLVITTFESGTAHDRVVSKLEVDGKLYVAANHWPRAWYRRALENPAVQVATDGTASDFRAVPVSGEEAEQVDREHPLGPVFRVLTGFPPRRFMRLDPPTD